MSPDDVNCCMLMLSFGESLAPHAVPLSAIKRTAAAAILALMMTVPPLILVASGMREAARKDEEATWRTFQDELRNSYLRVSAPPRETTDPAVSTAGASCTNATFPSARLASGLTMRDGVEVMIDSSSCGVRFGRSDRRRAAIPEMIGAANDVTERRLGFVPR